MLDRSLKAEFESYRKTLSTDEARSRFDQRIERLLSQHGIDYVRGYVDALKEAASWDPSCRRSVGSILIGSPDTSAKSP